MVYEHIGKSVFPQEVALLKMAGTLVSLGIQLATTLPLTSDIFSSKEPICLGATQGTKAGLEESNQLGSARGKIKPSNRYNHSIQQHG